MKITLINQTKKIYIENNYYRNYFFLNILKIFFTLSLILFLLIANPTYSFFDGVYSTNSGYQIFSLVILGLLGLLIILLAFISRNIVKNIIQWNIDLILQIEDKRFILNEVSFNNPKLYYRLSKEVSGRMSFDYYKIFIDQKILFKLDLKSFIKFKEFFDKNSYIEFTEK